MIIEIYNLDRKEYSRSKELYIVDFHKSGVHIDTGVCK